LKQLLALAVAIPLISDRASGQGWEEVGVGMLRSENGLPFVFNKM
jgi:hypothetical protein